MQGKTHISLGIASALLLTWPGTVTDVITSVTCGAIGGWIVDVDCKNKNVNLTDDQRREKIYDAIINCLFIAAFLMVDFLIGNGMFRYIKDNWGVKIWGALFAFVILTLIGFNTVHRTFTHSFLGMASFSGSIFLLYRPASIPFAVGYLSHLIADLFNMVGLQIFFPFKWRLCFKKCNSNNDQTLFRISTGLTLLLAPFLFIMALPHDVNLFAFITLLQKPRLFSINTLQLYLIFINIITFLGVQKDFKLFLEEIFRAYERGEVYDEEKSETPETRFRIWLLNFMVFIGGGVGLLLALLIYLEYPSAYNGNRWAICYTSILFWGTIYCYVCNPFGLEIKPVVWAPWCHIPLIVYFLGINAINALYIYTIRKKRFDEYNIRHTVVLLLGAAGGTIGAAIAALLTHHEGKYFYAVSGFLMMIMSQIIFTVYMLMTGLV